MPYRIYEARIPKYQTWGLVGIVLLFLVVILVFTLSNQHFHSDQRLNELRSELVNNRKAHLEAEIESAKYYIRFMYEQSEAVLKHKVQEEVNKAYNVARAIYKQSKDKLPEAEIKSLITETLRKMTFFNGRGYLFIDDMRGMCVLLPTAPHLEGTSLWNNQDDSGQLIMQGLIEAVNNDNRAGFSRYRWYAPGNRLEMQEKVTYVRYFEPFDWLIGTGEYIGEIQKDLQKTALERLSALRFGESGYMAILNKEGYLLHTAPLDGLKLPVHHTKLDDKKNATIKLLLETAEKGGGYIEYDWHLPNDPTKIVRKTSLVANAPEWGWILVAGVYPEKIKEQFIEESQDLRVKLSEERNNILITLALLGIAILLLAWLYGCWLRRLFKCYRTNIHKHQEKIAVDAKALNIAAKVFDSAHEGIMVTDADMKVVAVNPSFTKITGYSLSEILGKTPSILSSGLHTEEFYQAMWQSLEEKGFWSGEIWNRNKAGNQFPEVLTITVDKDETGELLHYIATFNDVSEQKDAEEKQRYLVEFDDLTGLPNRRLLKERVEHCIANSNSADGLCFVLMFIDLDRFKNINDSLGHTTGDIVLQKIADRLSAVVNESSTVSRIGGDEFVVVHSSSRNDFMISAATLAQELLRSVAEPIIEGDHQFVITPSIGIAAYPNDGESFMTLLRNADAALYHAKSQGRNNYQFYRREMNEKASSRLLLEQHLRVAIQQQDFELFYQPQFDTSGKVLTGCEALIRWKHQGNYVPPIEFISLCEETGLIVPLGEWVVEESCRQGVAWLDAGYDLPSIAINVSAVQLRLEFFEFVKEVLNKTGFPAEKLVLELTESELMQNVEQAIELLKAFKTLGLTIALDDFGTGYSSLAYLKRFSVDKLKIDRAFIDGLPSDKDDKAIASSILDIARNLGLETVAEGVETEAQLAFLRDYGCNFVQGYLLSKPVPASEMQEFLKPCYSE